jgi:hypothetical protein
MLACDEGSALTLQVGSVLLRCIFCAPFGPYDDRVLRKAVCQYKLLSIFFFCGAVGVRSYAAATLRTQWP